MNYIVNPKSSGARSACDIRIDCGSATCVGDCPIAAGCGINR